MPNHRLIPLLIVGAACLPLAACGSDDEPAATATQSGVPAETAPAAPSDATADAAPANTTEAPAPEGEAAATPEAEAPATEAPATDGANDGADSPSSSNDAPAKKDGAPKSSSSSSAAKTSSGPSKSSSKSKQPPAPEVPKVLEEYAKGGAPATADEAKSVRDTMLGFQDALVAQDAGKACSYTLGLPAKSDPAKPSPSCESLIEGSKMAPPTDQDRTMIQSAKITVSGDRASIEMGESGMPMPFRNVDGRWRIDYGTLLGIG